MHPETLGALHLAIQAEVANDPTQRGYAGKNAGQIAALMNSPIVSQPAPRPRAFRWGDARAIAQGAGEWPRIVVRSRQTPTVPPATSADAAILSAINAVSMEAVQILDPADDIEAAAFAAGIAALVAAGDLSQPVAARIGALAVETPPAETLPPRWLDVIEGIGGAGNEPGPPNAATEALIEGALA